MLLLPFASVFKERVGLPFCKQISRVYFWFLSLYFLCFGQVGNLRFFQGFKNTGSLDSALSVFLILSLRSLPADGHREFPVSTVDSFPFEPEAAKSN